MTTFIEDKIKDDAENKSQILATRGDIAKLEKRISKAKVDSIKWSIALWGTTIIMIAGLYLRK